MKMCGLCLQIDEAQILFGFHPRLVPTLTLSTLANHTFEHRLTKDKAMIGNGLELRNRARTDKKVCQSLAKYCSWRNTAGGKTTTFLARYLLEMHFQDGL